MADNKNSHLSQSSGRMKESTPTSENGLAESKGKNQQVTFKHQSSRMSTTDDIDGMDDKKVAWETMLPSKRTNTIDVRTWGKTTSRTRRMSTLRPSDYSPTDETEMGMMPDLSEGLPNEEEMWQKMQQIRSLPISMEEKRKLKAELKVAQNLRVYGFELIRYRKRQLWHRIRHYFSHILSFVSPWKSSIRSIEANFGTGVASYFLLIRWQMLLNVLISIIVFSLIIIPWGIGQQSCENFNQSSLIKPETVLDGCSRSNNYSACDAECVKLSDECWLKYREDVMMTIDNHSYDPLLLIQDTIQGTGWLELTIAFYGFYQPAFLNWGDDQVYNFSLAYELVVYSVLIFSLACIAKSVATGFKTNIGLGRSWLHQFSDIAFTSWDYCIDSAKVAQHKKKTVLHAFRAALEEKNYANEKARRSAREKMKLFFVRAFVNFSVIVTLCIAGFIIYMVTSFSEDNRKNSSSTDGSFENGDEFRILIIGFLPSIVITGLNFCVPILFRNIVRFEKFSATFEIKLTLVRTILLRLASLLVLVLTLYSNLKNASTETCNVAQFNPSQNASMCWETYVGQQLYRLCLFDIFVTIMITFFVDLPLALLCRRSVSPTSRLNCIANPEFNLVGSTLDMVYSQSICWLGMFYCPILPIITALKCIFVFYIKYLSLVLYSSPPSRIYGASSSTSLFMNVLLVSFISCALPLGYHVTSITPSKSCGPFRGFGTVWSAISSEVGMLPVTLKDFIFFFGTAGFFVPAILMLLVALYYFRSKAKAHRAVVQSLTQQLVLEAEDKQFLLARLTTVSKESRAVV